VFTLAIAVNLSVSADSHDDSVYQRYSRRVTPGKIPYEFDMKFTELKRPGTQQDVENGGAVFTFEGIGSSRVWKLPKCPIFCEWPSLKDYPFGGQSNSAKTNFDDFGNVCQAEELLINGQWKRYFGFVCKYGTAVVPAEEIYLSFNDLDSASHRLWIELPGGIDLGVVGPAARMQNGMEVPVILKVGDPLRVELYVRNRRGVAQKVLEGIYRDEKNRGPAFHKGIRLFLGWAPFNPKTPDRNYPHMEDFKPVSAVRTNLFSTGDAGPVLATGEEARRANFDIRDWFNVALPGYYQYHFEFNSAELGLPTDERTGGGVYITFNVGSEPRRLTVDELNRDISAFGGPDREESVRALIKRSIGDNRRHWDQSQRVPEHLPKLNHTSVPSENGSPSEPEIVGLRIANRELLERLNLEGRDQHREKLEALMKKERALSLKLLLASEAAPLGSERAAMFLLECMKNTDFEVAGNTHAALRFALNHYPSNPPPWLVELAITALSDDRYVTGLQKAGWTSDTFFTMSYMADEEGDLTSTLGYLKCTNAVPFLIQMAKKTNGRRGPVMALGDLGDLRAIPTLIEFVKQKGPTAKQEKGMPLDGGFLRPVVALGKLRAKEAVPVLLEYLEHPAVIEALENIGDSRAIAPLQKLIVSKGRLDTKSDFEFEQQRLAAARIAVASLDPSDRTARLCELLTDASFNQYQRRSVVWRLGDHPDSRAIPFLGKVIKTDPSGAVVNQAITVLAIFKYKTAVEVLIDCFDADFRGKSDWKRAYKPEMFRDNIADSLSQLTGQHMSADRQQWLNWWKEHRDTPRGLK